MALAAASAAVAEGQRRSGDLLVFVASEMTRVRRWKRTQVSKLLEKDGQRMNRVVLFTINGGTDTI